MDSFDRILLAELAANCRVSFTDLAEKYSFSVNTIKKKVEDLVQEGVIHAFDVQISLRSVGASFAVTMIELNSDWSGDRLKELGKHPNIYSIASGIRSEALVLVIYRSNQELTEVVDFLQSTPGVSKTETVPLLYPLSAGEMPPSKGLEDLKRIDWMILQKLKWNGRMQLGELANVVGASPASVRKRLQFMLKNGLINQTILVNPSLTKGLVVMYALSIQELSSEIQHRLDLLLAETFPDNYWLSWRVADRSLLLLTFQVQSTKDALEIRDRLLELIPDSSIAKQLLVGVWEYFPDFRDDLIASRLESYKK